MKQFFKKICVFLALIAVTSFTFGTINATPTYAEDNTLGSCRYFLGMTSWDCGVPNVNNQEALSTAIWTIVANVLTDMIVIAAYLMLGFTIYGGYLYIFSSGDVGKIQNGKKTLTRAFIGMAIVTLANVILTAIRFALIQRSGSFIENCTGYGTSGVSCTSQYGEDVITNLIQWFIGTAGIVSAIFVVIGGIGYVTSSGDAGKLQKAKTTILYALIGLVIVALAEVITAFVSNIANEAANSARLDHNTSLIIAKE